MQQIPLGQTGQRTSEFCLGRMTWGTQADEAGAHDQIDLALEHGVTFRDTTAMYPANPVLAEMAGRIEEIIGRRTAKGGPRDRVILATKVADAGRGALAGAGRWPGVGPHGQHPERAVAAVPAVRHRPGRTFGDEGDAAALPAVSGGPAVGQIRGRCDPAGAPGAAPRPPSTGGSRRRCSGRMQPVAALPRGTGLAPAGWRWPSAGRGPARWSRSRGARTRAQPPTVPGTAGMVPDDAVQTGIAAARRAFPAPC